MTRYSWISASISARFFCPVFVLSTQFFVVVVLVALIYVCFNLFLRVSVRAITADQTMHKIFAEDLRAYVRSESDRAMLSMLQAMVDDGDEGAEEGHSLVSVPTQSEDDSSTGASTTSVTSASIISAESTKSSPQVTSSATPAVQLLSSMCTNHVSPTLEPITNKIQGAATPLDQNHNRTVDQQPTSATVAPAVEVGPESASVSSESLSSQHGDEAASVSVSSSKSKSSKGSTMLHPKKKEMPINVATASANSEQKTGTGEGYRQTKAAVGTTGLESIAENVLNLGVTKTVATTAASNSKIVSGAAFEVKVTMSHNVEYQIGSQGYTLGNGTTFRNMETQLSADVLKRIEEREMALFELRLEAAKLLKRYFEQEVAVIKLPREKLIGKILTDFDRVRDVTVRMTQSLGAWIRRCSIEKQKHQHKAQANYMSIEKAGTRGLREYVVAIARRGSMLYDRSTALQSQSKKFRRGDEIPKYGTDVVIVGVFKSERDAGEAFSLAMSQIPSELVLLKDAESRYFIGLRECRKHYLVRSASVPPDTPCEQCAARSLSKPKNVVPAIVDALEPVQQFIYKGQDYIEKIWSDLDYLKDNMAVNKLFPTFEFESNPLLLPTTRMQKIIATINVESSASYLQNLKSRLEKVSDAKKAGTRVDRKLTGQELMGIAYDPTFKSLQLSKRLVDDDANDPLRGMREPTYRLSESVSAGQANSTGLLGTESLRPGSPDIGGSITAMGVSTARAASPGFRSFRRVGINATGLDLLDMASRHQHNLFSTIDSSAMIFDDCSYWQDGDLARALAVIGQSSTLSEEKLPKGSIPTKLAGTALERTRSQELEKSKSAPPISILQAAAPTLQEKLDTLKRMAKAHDEGDGKTEVVEARYTDQGAILQTTQVTSFTDSLLHLFMPQTICFTFTCEYFSLQ